MLVCVLLVLLYECLCCFHIIKSVVTEQAPVTGAEEYPKGQNTNKTKSGTRVDYIVADATTAVRNASARKIQKRINNQV